MTATTTNGGPWWGTGAAATQCEGAAPRADWAGWEAEGRVPPSRDGNGFRSTYADDFALWAEHGLRRYRLTVEWARLEPWPGQWDETEAEHVVRALRAARAAGVEPWVCLLHGSAPGWFTDDERGWLDERAATLTWPRHVDRVAEAVGDLVAGWIPVHDLDLQARLGYLDGSFPPGRRNEDDHREARGALLTAEREAARLLRGGGRPVAVTARPGDAHDGDELLAVTAPVGGLARALEATVDAAPHAGLIVVTGDPVTAPAAGDADAERRAGRLREAVAVAGEAAAGGADVRGGFVLPAVDGYEWHRGFDARLGLFDRERHPRPAVDVIGRAPAPPTAG